jgi:hypothetical protein
MEQLSETGQRVENDPYVKGNIYPITIKSSKEQFFCKSCGADISHQTTKKFCTAKYVGEKKAHQCRNLIYNRIHNPITKLKRLKDKQQILYTDPSLFPVFIHLGIL